jgi:large subunit ribosomal protein L28
MAKWLSSEVPFPIPSFFLRVVPVARSCQVCGKGFSVGNQVTIRGKAKYLGGVGTKVTGITRRKFKPNLQRLRVTIGKGTNTSLLVCTQCIKGGKVTKLVRQKPFRLPTVEKAKTVAEEAVPSGPRARP